MPLLAVNHHYFRDKLPNCGIYPITSKALTNQVNTVREYWRMANESDVLKYCNGELATDDYICLFTFDDGLKEQLEAIRLLESLGAIAICFVPTAAIVNRVVLDVHKLHMIRSCRDDEELSLKLNKRFDFGNYSFDDELLAIQYRYDQPVSRRVKYYLNFVLDKCDRDAWVSELFVEIFGSEKAASDKLYMNMDDLKFLAQRNILGTHAHMHVPLATLSSEECEAEILESLEILEKLSGDRVKGISYPFGGKSAVSETVFSLSKKSGLTYGFTMERGINGANENNPFALKRIDTNDVSQWIDKQ